VGRRAPALFVLAVDDCLELTAVGILEEDADGDLVVSLLPFDLGLVEAALQL
jgi:hypothetical protein